MSLGERFERPRLPPGFDDSRAHRRRDDPVGWRFDEAERHYDHILTLPMGREPAYALGKAQAQFGLDRFADTLVTLDHLKEQWPDFESAEGHLLYARSLAEIGRIDEALDEYHALAAYLRSSP